jgi:hypothetical protein
MIAKSQTYMRLTPGILSLYLGSALAFEFYPPFRDSVVRALGPAAWGSARGGQAAVAWLLAQLDAGLSFLSGGYYSTEYGVFIPFSAGIAPCLPLVLLGLVLMVRIVRNTR